MSAQEKSMTIRLYYTPQVFPCGEQSTCCGPVGQSEEELQGYVSVLKEALPEVDVECVDVGTLADENAAEATAVVSRLIGSFGKQACPLFVHGNDVLSMGPADMGELIQTMRGRAAVGG